MRELTPPFPAARRRELGDLRLAAARRQGRPGVPIRGHCYRGVSEQPEEEAATGRLSSRPQTQVTQTPVNILRVTRRAKRARCQRCSDIATSRCCLVARMVLLDFGKPDLT